MGRLPGKSEDLTRDAEFTSCNVKWAADPKRSARLLAWLEVHPIERNILLRADRRNGSSPPSTIRKGACGQRAAAAVFSDDQESDGRLRRMARFNLVSLGHSVTGLIMKTWRTKYQQVTKKIGPAAANLRCEGMDRDVLEKLEKLTETFPEWKVLHKYWRTDRHFNTFYPAASSVDGVESETGAADGSANMHIDPPVERDNEPRIRTRGWSRGHTSAGGNPAIILEDTPPPPAPQAAMENRNAITDNEWDATEQQKHKLRLSELQLMAEIELKKRRLELEYEERQRAAEIFREQLRERAQNQREIVAHFAAFVSTGPRRELRQPR